MKLFFTIVLISLIPVSVNGAPGDPRSPAQLHLDRALRLANAYNWLDAAPDFAQAERLFVAERNEKGAYQARLGRMRTLIERGGALPKLIVQLADDLESIPFLKSDLRLRMFCLIVKGDFDGESDHAAMARDWDEVRTLAAQLGDQKWEIRATAQLGIAAYYNADVKSARERIGYALLASRKLGDRPGEMMTLAIMTYGLCFANMYSQALPYADQSIDIAKSDTEIGYPHVAYQAKLNVLIGNGDLNAARQLADGMLAYARKRRFKALEAGILTELAQIAQLLHDQNRAIALLNEAVPIASSGGYLNTLATAQEMLTEIYLDRKEPRKAEAHAAQAAASAQARGDFVTLPARLTMLGRLEVDEGKYAEADRTFTRASAFVDSMLGRSQAARDRTSVLAASSELYQRHFALIADHFDDPRRAYAIIEQVRGRVTADLLAAGAAPDPKAKIAEQLASRERLKLIAARSDADVKRISDQLFFIEQARLITPDVSILRAKVGTQVSLIAVQRSLPPSTVVLEYVMGDPDAYCLVISRSGSRIVRLPSSNSIEQDVVSYLKAIKAKQPASDKARCLYASLLQPIRETADAKNFVIVRDGQLHLLPFDSLVDDGGGYIAESKVVSYAPSVSSFALLRLAAHRKHGGGALLGVGAIPYDGASVRNVKLTRGYETNSFADLPESKDELLAASNAVQDRGNTLLVGPAATEAAFKREPLEEFRVLHLAVHAVANTAQPERAALIMLSDRDAGEDGFLQASEIVHLKLNADLVVLSACDTAIGPIVGEEGIATLSRAFLVAGAKTVVSTLWSIEDSSSLALMRGFYHHLASHEPANQALSEAKRDIIRKFGRKAPAYYWAAFTLEGAGDEAVL